MPILENAEAELNTLVKDIGDARKRDRSADITDETAEVLSLVTGELDMDLYLIYFVSVSLYQWSACVGYWWVRHLIVVIDAACMSMSP